MNERPYMADNVAVQFNLNATSDSQQHMTDQQSNAILSVAMAMAREWERGKNHRKNIWWNFVGPIFPLFATERPSEDEANICFLFRQIMFIQWCTQCTSTQPIIIVIFINKIAARIHALISNAVQNTKFTQNDKLWTKWIDAHSTRRNISNLIIHFIVVHSNIKRTHVVFFAIHPNTHTHSLSLMDRINASKCTSNGHDQSTL